MTKLKRLYSFKEGTAVKAATLRRILSRLIRSSQMVMFSMVSEDFYS